MIFSRAITSPTPPLIVGFLLMMVVMALGTPSPQQPAPAVKTKPVAAAVPPGRLVVYILDALRLEAMTEPDTVPLLRAFARKPGVNWIPVRTCKGNFTLPCMQTLMEGKESPFTSGLHNFTGVQGAHDSLPGMVRTRGEEVVLIADHPVSSMYRSYARVTHNTDTWPGTYLQRDLRAFDVALEHLRQDRRLRLLILHTIGSDKATHHFKPGDKPYVDHFNAVDRKLMELISALDLSRDALIITGDHGHNTDGHHTRRSLAVFAGRPYQELFAAWQRRPARVEQKDMLYLMAYALGLALPPAYEGAYFSTDRLGSRQPSTRVRSFEAMQSRVLRDRGYQGASLTRQLRGARVQMRQHKRAELLAGIPLLLCYLGLLAWWPLLKRPRQRWLAVIGVGLAALAMARLVPPGAAPYLGLAVGGAALVPLRFAATRRRTLLIVLLTVLAAALSYVALPWSRFFHISDGFSMTFPFFLLLVPATGAALAWLDRGTPRRLVPGTILFCLICLPAGVYFYQFGPNILRGGITAVLVLALVLLARRGRRVLDWLRRRGRALVVPLLLCCYAVPFIYAQAAGGWEWGGSYLEDMLYVLPGWAGWVLYYLTGLGAASLLRGTAARVLVLLLWIMAQLFAVQLGQMSPRTFIASFLPVLFFMGWLELYLQWRAHGHEGAQQATDHGDPDTISLMLMAAVAAAIWFIFRGYFFIRVDFSFAFKYVSPDETERLFAARTGALIVLKYGLPSVILVLHTCLRLGRRRAAALLAGMLYFFHLKLAMLMVQILAGALGTSEKLYQLFVGDFFFLSALMLLACISFGLYWLGGTVSRLVFPGRADRARPEISEEAVARCVRPRQRKARRRKRT